MAVLLLSLGNMHFSSTQMALDMLARLNGVDEIQEVLLSENQLLAALKLAKNEANPRKYLAAAKDSENDTLLHNVLYYFRNHPKYSSILQNGKWQTYCDVTVSATDFVWQMKDCTPLLTTTMNYTANHQPNLSFIWTHCIKE